MKKKTVESKGTATFLQESKEIEVGGKIYKVAPPSIATLAKVSALVSTMPEIDNDTEDPISEALRVGKDCNVIGDILATIVLGVKKERTSLLGIWQRLRDKSFRELSDKLLTQKTPKEISEMISDLLVNHMEIGFFLNIGISLSAANMMKPTKTTASGQ